VVTAIIAATGTPIIAVMTVIIMATIITMTSGVTPTFVASVSPVVARISRVAAIPLRVVLPSLVILDTTASAGAALPRLSVLERDEDEGGGNATDEPGLDGHGFTP
jgi:hypothetical protein